MARRAAQGKEPIVSPWEQAKRFGKGLAGPMIRKEDLPPIERWWEYSKYFGGIPAEEFEKNPLESLTGPMIPAEEMPDRIVSGDLADDLGTSLRRFLPLPQGKCGPTKGQLGAKAKGKPPKSSATAPSIRIRNRQLAGKVHPKTGIPFDKNGYPDFSKVATHTVKIKQKGSYTTDFTKANQKAGVKSTPPGYTWHHHQDGKTMQLVPTAIHRQTGHTGDVAHR